MLLRLLHSKCKPQAIVSQIGLSLLLATPIFVGCRTPWRATSNEPSFDRLIEIEQSKVNSSGRDPMASRLRASDSKYPVASRAKPLNQDASESIEPGGAESVDDQQLEEMLADVPPAQREFLRREIRARSAQDNLDNELVFKDTPPRAAANSPKASKRFQDDATDSNSAVVFSLSDDGEDDSGESESESSLGNSKYQMAANSAHGKSNATSSRARMISDRDGTEADGEASSSQPAQSGVVSLAAATQTSDEVVSASYNRANAPEENGVEDLDWREHIYQALSKLEQQGATNSPEELVHKEMVDRLLHLSLGDMNAASKPIDGLQTHGQDFIRHSLESLHEVTNSEGNPVETKRYSLAMLSQRKALNHLAAVSNLEVRNVALCTEVDGFGVVSKFPQYNFQPDQELLLYCELDNFVSTFAENKGYETQLQGSYEIVDDSGRRVADQLLPLDSHLCRNQRRDYFIAYRIYMPQKIEPGRYTLKLTVEDMKGRKFGQSALDFQITK